MKRRNLLRRLLAAAWAVPLVAPARAQGFPARSIQLVVPYPAGGPTDRVCRLAAELVAARLGQAVVILNQPGAAGTLGIVNTVLPARPDGYTLGLFTGSMLRAPVLQGANWHPINDFSFVAGLLISTGHDMGLVVRAESPFRTFADVVAAARRDPGGVSFGTAGIGSSNHLAVAQLAEAAGIKLVHVPYKGSADMIPAVMGGHVAMVADLAGGWSKLVEDGQLRLLLTFGDKASPHGSQVPTARSLGYGVSGVYTMSIVGPAGLDRAVVDVLHGAFAAAAADPRVVALLAQQHQQPWPVDPAALRAWNAEQFERERAAIRRLGLGPG